MKKPNLKSAMFYTLSKGINKPFEQYIIETLTDLNAFIKEFPKMRMSITIFKKSIQLGNVLVLSEPHKISGMNTYRYETVPVAGKKTLKKSYIRL